MKLFDRRERSGSPRTARIYACYELAYTCVDFSAAFLFIVGSVLFFKESTAATATWMFLVGSICFALKPTLRLTREIHLYRIGQTEKLAERLAD